MTRPAKLQINQRGAWRDVMRFDLDQMVAPDLFLETAAEMVRYSGQDANTTMRVVTDAALPQRVMDWDAEGGWQAAPNAPSNASEPVPNRPSANAGASGPAVAENGSKAMLSKGT